MQRFFEIRFDGTTKQPVIDRDTGIPVRKDRYLNLLWPQITEIYDRQFGPEQGTRWTHAQPLTLATRFPIPKNKKPRI